MDLRSGRRVGDKPPQPQPHITVPSKFPWRLPPLQAQDVLNLIQFLAICMTWEVMQTPQLKLTPNQDDTDVDASGEAQSTLTSHWIHAVAALAAVSLKGLIVQSILRQREIDKSLAHWYGLFYIFMPLFTYTVTSSIWNGILTVGFPDINSIWVVSLVAQRALENRVVESICDREEAGYFKGYELCFLATECGVVFFYSVVWQLCFSCLTSPSEYTLTIVQFFCYCAAVVLRLLYLYCKGERHPLVSSEKQLDLLETCLSHYLRGFQLRLVGDSTSDTAAVFNNVKKVIWQTLGCVFLCTIFCVVGCADRNMHSLAIVGLTCAMSLLLLFSVFTMRRIGSNVRYNRTRWYHQPLFDAVNSSWWKCVLGAECDLLLLCFTQKEIDATKANPSKPEETGFPLANHPLADLYSDAEQTAGSRTVLSRLSDFLCCYALFLSLFCLLVAHCTSYVDCPEWLKGYLNWCIEKCLVWLSEKYECPSTKCAGLNNSIKTLFQCYLEKIFKCGSTFEKTTQIWMEIMGWVGIFPVLLYAFYRAVPQMCKVIKAHIFYTVFLFVLAYMLSEFRAFDTVAAKIELDTLRLYAAQSRQRDTDYDTLATLLGNNKVQLVNNTDPVAVEAYVMYHNQVLSALTEALKTDTPTSKKMHMAHAAGLIQHAFKTYTNGTISDMDPDIKVTWPDFFQILKEKCGEKICEFGLSLGGFCLSSTS